MNEETQITVSDDNKDYILKVENLKQYFPVTKSMFGKPKAFLRAVDGVSFRLERGKTIGIVGESGCGKTTLGRTILRLYDITEGSALYVDDDGTEYELAKLKRKELRPLRTKLQYVFQDPYSSLPPRMTVGEIISEGVKTHKIVPKEEVRDYVINVMKRCGLQEHYYDRYPHEFSGGQRQRIGIARALALKPEFIVCDEPVSALDVSIQAQVINMFDELQDKMGLTYLFIAHDILVVRHISDRIAVMYLGKMVELADAAEIYERPLHPYTKSLMSAVPQPDPKVARANKRIVLSGDIPSPLNAPSGCPFRTRCPYAQDKCAEAMPEFKEVASGHFVACHRVAEIN